MKRKVIQIAKSTQLVSLPRDWAVAHHVKKGDEVEVLVDKNRITITAGPDTNLETTNIDLAGMTKLRRPMMRGCYTRGYDEIEINYAPPSYIQTIQQYIGELPGFDIVRQGATRCVIRSISAPQPGEFEHVFNRLFLLLQDTAESVAKAVREHDTELLQSVPYREVSINKFVNFCRRLINKRVINDVSAAPEEYVILTLLEYLGDEYKALCARILAHEGKTDGLPDLLDSLAKNLATIYRLHSNFRKEVAIQNAIEHDAIVERISSMCTPKCDAIIYHHLMTIATLLEHLREVVLYKSM